MRVLPVHSSQCVAVQVAFESKGLKPVSHLIGLRVETRRFQAMGKLDSPCTAPPVPDVVHGVVVVDVRPRKRGVAVQVDTFESKL
jgi:hypothetical protein